MTKCPNCKSKMRKVMFDAGYGVNVESMHCDECGFNMTDPKKLKAALGDLKNQMAKEVKIVSVGTGLGLRFPNEIVKQMKLKKGEQVLLKPEEDGLKVVI